MTDSKTPDPTKVEADADPNLMSLDDLDRIIAEADPNALKEIEGVREIASEMNGTFELLELDDELLEGTDASKKKKGDRKARIKLKLILLWVWLKSSTIEGGKKSLTWAQEKRKLSQEGLRAFKFWPTPKKLMMFGAIGIMALVISFSYLAFVKGSLFYKPELFMTSLDHMAEKTFDTSEDEAKETFYNSARIPKSLFKLKKIVVNITPSEGSGPNPMVAIEFSLEGNSSEVLIEIKDREGEILDQVQRTVEAYSFDELNTMEGKKVLTEKVRGTVNKLLTLGKIRKVYLQGLILKP